MSDEHTRPTLDLTKDSPESFASLGANVGTLVDQKQLQYGDSAGKTGSILKVLFPAGIQPHQFNDLQLVVRILDKISRIAQRRPDGLDLGGESPYRDIVGYGLLGLRKDGGK